MSHGLSFKTVKDTSLSKFKAKLDSATSKGWRYFGETTKEGDAYYQVLAKHKVTKKHEAQPQLT